MIKISKFTRAACRFSFTCERIMQLEQNQEVMGVRWNRIWIRIPKLGKILKASYLKAPGKHTMLIVLIEFGSSYLFNNICASNWQKCTADVTQGAHFFLVNYTVKWKFIWVSCDSKFLWYVLANRLSKEYQSRPCRLSANYHYFKPNSSTSKYWLDFTHGFFKWVDNKWQGGE